MIVTNNSNQTAKPDAVKRLFKTKHKQFQELEKPNKNIEEVKSKRVEKATIEFKKPISVAPDSELREVKSPAVCLSFRALFSDALRVSSAKETKRQQRQYHPTGKTGLTRSKVNSLSANPAVKNAQSESVLLDSRKVRRVQKRAWNANRHER